MNPFEVGINDIFSNSDFLESCMIGTTAYPCIVSAIPADSVYSEYGFDEGITFDLSIRVSDLPDRPKKNTILNYKDTDYRIAETTLDSAGLTWKIFLKSKTTI